MSQPALQASSDADIVALPVPRTTRRTILMILGGVIGLVVLALGFRAFVYGRAHESTDDAQVEGHIVPVMARIGGYVSQVAVDNDDTVRAGQVLVRIDSADAAVKLIQADAEIAAASAAVSQAEAMRSVGSEQRGAASSQIVAARASADKAHNDLARARQLAERQLVSRQQLDAAQAASDAADATLETATRTAGAAAGTATGAEAAVRAAQARLAAARAVRSSAELSLSYAHVTAPSGGVIARRSVEPGQLLQAGQPLLAIVSDTLTWVTANFKETQLAQMRVGQKATIEVDAYPGCEAEGTVMSLSPATGARFALLPPDNATGNFTKVVQRVPVRIHVDQGCGAAKPLRPGLSVSVHVATK
jgi:membrane fusion protein (multidrug efflux system)